MSPTPIWWLHLIWETLNREKILPKEAAARVSRYLTEYTEGKSVYMKIKASSTNWPDRGHFRRRN